MVFCALFPLFTLSSTFACPIQLADTRFIDLTSSSSGGAIYASSSSCVVLITSCTFYNCSTNSYGGAIYAVSSNITCIGTCISNCSSSYEGIACYSSSTYIQFMLDEVSECYSYSTSDGLGTLYFLDSYATLTPINISGNTAECDASAFYICSSSKTVISVGSLCNCTDILYGATIDLHGAASTINVSLCNVVGNRPKSLWGLIWIDESNSHTQFYGCFFADNGDYSYAKIGTGGTNSYPSFYYCAFDVASSRLSGSALVSCAFGVSSGTTIPNSLLTHQRCAKNPQTDFFSRIFASSRIGATSLIASLACAIYGIDSL